MSCDIKIRMLDYYSNPVGETEYILVSTEVYEILEHTFRKEAHAEFMRDYRNLAADGYKEGDTEGILLVKEKSVEEKILHAMDIQLLWEAIQCLTPIQRERVQLYFFDRLTYRQIAEKLGVREISVRESINNAIKKLKKFFN